MISSCFVRGWMPCAVLSVWLAGMSLAAAQTSGTRTGPTPKPSASPSATPYVLPEVVATVDGEPIRKSEVATTATLIAASQGKAMQDLPTADQKKAYQAVTERLVIEKLVAKAAVNEPVSDIDLEKSYGAVISQYPDPKAYDDELKKSGKTAEQVKVSVRKQLAEQHWLERQVADDIKVTPEEVQKFYKESPSNKFDVPEMVRARQLFVEARKDAPPEDSYLAEQRVNKLAERIKGGEAFAAVAKTDSDDKGTRENGGDLGYFTRDKIMPEIADAAFKLKTNEVSAPIRTRFGFHLVQAVDHKPPHTATLGEAQDQITSYLQSEKQQRAMAEVVRHLRDKAKIQSFMP